MVDYELNELKREFLDEADAKVREIEESLQGRFNGGSLDRLAYLAHQLKGSGGSYGYASISSNAAEIEKAAEAIVSGKSDRAEEKIRGFIASLRDEITRSRKDLASAV